MAALDRELNASKLTPELSNLQGFIKHAFVIPEERKMMGEPGSQQLTELI